MARIQVSSDPGAPKLVIVRVVELAESWALQCSRADSSGECLNDLAAGDTWSSLEPAVQDAMTHVDNHQSRAGA